MTKKAPKYSGPELCAKEAHVVVDMLRAKEVSPDDLIDAALARISQVEPQINAVPTLCETRARDFIEQNKPFDTAHPGALMGLPIGIKDLNTVKGVRTTWGSAALANFIPDESDPLVELLEERGATVLGKTNTPEFGAGGNTFNDVFGPTLNPWDTRLNAGGSSGGAAASLATGEFWLSHGSDHGGSLRTPASFCGIVGLRPSPGIAGGPGKDTAFIIEGVQGPMARSVMDCALFLDAMSGWDARLPISFPAPDMPYQQSVRRAKPDLKIAYAPDLGGFAQVDAEVRDHLNAVMTKLEANGADITDACPDLTLLETTYHTLRGLMWATAARRTPQHILDAMKPTLRENTEFGRKLSVDDIVDANLNRSTIFANMISLFQTHDVLACPVVGCMPHPQSEEWVREIDGVKLDGYMDWLRFAFLATTTGLPAISVPTGLGPRGLPVGLQLIGKPRGEAALLAAARIVEQTCGGPIGPIDPITR